MRKRILSVLLTVCLGLSLAACGGGGETAEETTTAGEAAAESTEAATAGVNQGPIEASEDEVRSDKDTLIVAFDREPATLDPLGNNVTVKRMIEGGIFDTLLKFDENLQPSPCLAESWEQLDELTWQFNLRKDAKFHNGDPVTSKDVLFSFMRVHNGTLGNDGTNGFDPEGYETPDDYTFILKTLEPYAFTEAQLCKRRI